MVARQLITGQYQIVIKQLPDGSSTVRVSAFMFLTGFKFISISVNKVSDRNLCLPAALSVQVAVSVLG